MGGQPGSSCVSCVTQVPDHNAEQAVPIISFAQVIHHAN
jgi:hypothetical protein